MNKEIVVHQKKKKSLCLHLLAGHLHHSISPEDPLPEYQLRQAS